MADGQMIRFTQDSPFTENQQFSVNRLTVADWSVLLRRELSAEFHGNEEYVEHLRKWGFVDRCEIGSSYTLWAMETQLLKVGKSTFPLPTYMYVPSTDNCI